MTTETATRTLADTVGRFVEETNAAPFVPQPTTVEETGLDFSMILDLVVKAIHFAGRPAARQIAAQIALPFNVVDEVLAFMKREQLAEVVGSFDGVDWGVLFAAATVQLLPVLVFVWASQKYLVAGLTAGATKG